jgi:pimeloyl-ACP methyl ester carboxylesterase
MDRRAFLGMLAAASAASPLIEASAQAAEPAPKAHNVVLAHGLFADGSCRSEVIARLQAAGMNVTAVQNPLTTLEEAVASAERALALQDGPTVLVGHSFSGMIVTEAGVDPKVTSLVYVAARAPDAGEDYAALAKQFPTPPASAGIVWSGDGGSSARPRSCATSPATCPRPRRACCMRSKPRSRGHCSPARRPTPPGDRNRAGMPSRPRTAPSTPISSGSWPSEWAPRRSRSRRAICRSSLNPTPSPS